MVATSKDRFCGRSRTAQIRSRLNTTLILSSFHMRAIYEIAVNQASQLPNRLGGKDAVPPIHGEYGLLQVTIFLPGLLAHIFRLSSNLWTVARAAGCCKQIERLAGCAPKAATSTAIDKAEPLLDARTKTGLNRSRVGEIDYYSASLADRTRLLTVCSRVVRSKILPAPAACLPDQLTLRNRVAKLIHDRGRQSGRPRSHPDVPHEGATRYRPIEESVSGCNGDRPALGDRPQTNGGG